MKNILLSKVSVFNQVVFSVLFVPALLAGFFVFSHQADAAVDISTVLEATSTPLLNCNSYNCNLSFPLHINPGTEYVVGHLQVQGFGTYAPRLSDGSVLHSQLLGSRVWTFYFQPQDIPPGGKDMNLIFDYKEGFLITYTIQVFGLDDKEGELVLQNTSSHAANQENTTIDPSGADEDLFFWDVFNNLNQTASTVESMTNESGATSIGSSLVSSWEGWGYKRAYSLQRAFYSDQKLSQLFTIVPPTSVQDGYIYRFSFNSSSTTPEPKRNPVIIVPGIMGSYLKETAFPFDKEIWLNLAGYALPGEDGGLRRLEMDENGKAIEDLYVDKAIEKVSKEDFYKGLIEELKAKGYEENKDLFVFPYDWRYDIDCLAGVTMCVDSGIDSLKKVIMRVTGSTGSEKVDIVAHSMGGLIAKTYIEKFGTSTVDKLITIATPNLGSPRSVKMLLYGDNMDIGNFGVYILSEGTMKEVSQNIPSVYNLLPSQEYFNLSGSYIADIYDADNNGIKGNLNYLDANDFLVNTGRNRYLLDKAVALHNKIDGFQVKDSFSISGCKKPTIDKIYILNKEKSGGYEYGLRYTSGDGTVPLRSADYFGDQKYYAYPGDHGKISSSDGVRQLVGAILDNTQASFDFLQYQNVSSIPVGCNLSGTQISYHSPVTLSAHDQYGNHVGKTDNGDTEINIPGAQYDEIDGNKFIFLPTGGNYTITGQATASGSFNARVETIEAGQYTKESYFNEVPLNGTLTKVEMVIVDNQESYSIKVDQNGDGTNMEEIVPDSVLTETEMSDAVKPVTSINLSGTSGNNGYYVSAAKVNLTATDDNSGVLKTEYSLDGGNNWIKYEGEFAISQDGITTILYSSTDKAGNREDDKAVTIKVDQTKPIVSPLLPQEGQELLHSNKLNITYFATDNFSGIATATEEVYLDGQIASLNTVDLFKQNLGQHQIKITIQDLAGNQSEQAVNFLVIASVDGTIADVNRSYEEKMITKLDVRNYLVNRLIDIKDFQEKYGQRIEKEKEMRNKAMAQCLKYKSQTWCNNKIGTIFDRFDYRLSKINQAVIKIKYNLILAKLDLYLKVKWINQDGYNIIKEDIKYLINKI